MFSIALRMQRWSVRLDEESVLFMYATCSSAYFPKFKLILACVKFGVHILTWVFPV